MDRDPLEALILFVITMIGISIANIVFIVLPLYCLIKLLARIF